MDLRITDLAVTPDLTRIIAVGMDAKPMATPGDGRPPASRSNSGIFGGGAGGANSATVTGPAAPRLPPNMINIYDLKSKDVEA